MGAGLPFSLSRLLFTGLDSFRRKGRWEPIALANILTVPGQEGISISGGEPFTQPLGLLQLLEKVKEINPLYSVIVFTGNLYEHLHAKPGDDPTRKLLEFVDVLIDGPYMQNKNDNKGLRGSSNQHIHYLTPRYKDWDFENDQRIQEYYVEDANIQVVGIPDLTGGFFVKNNLKEAIR